MASSIASNNTLCPSDNAQITDQSTFWDEDGLNWDTHRIGWVIAGSCALVTLIITIINVSFHARSYTNPGEQRQIIRILYMPAVYAIISFFSYRFFRSYTYYELIETAMEHPSLFEHSVTLSAFLLLLIEYVAATAVGHDVDNAILRKEKSSLPIPFCCWRYRPTKAYFMYTVKWSVLQYVILRPVLSIAGIVCEKIGVLCQSGPWSFKTAHAYLSVIDFVSISIALYGLLVFYGLTKDELQGRKPLAKFMSIKLIVMFTFYQTFVFSALEGRVIHATQYWTETNIADGLNALAICIEMVFFSAFMLHAYSWKEYKVADAHKDGAWKAIKDSINYSDFAREIGGSVRFFIDYWRGKPGTHGPRVPVIDAEGKPQKMDFGQAFGLTPRPDAFRTGSHAYQRSGSGSHSSAYSRSGSGRGLPGAGTGMGESMSMSAIRPPRQSFDEHVRLAPYSYDGGSQNVSTASLNAPPPGPPGPTRPLGPHGSHEGAGAHASGNAYAHGDVYGNGSEAYGNGNGAYENGNGAGRYEAQRLSAESDSKYHGTGFAQ
ncbi:organic solute transporter Ostalpha-domain-containing protein [Fomes fomentarius]|nr:organic solute transporter Ostalpha-domain-containing protein [Fomes fomentarius]